MIDMDDKRRLKINIALKTIPDIKQKFQNLKTGMDDGISTEILEQLSEIIPKQEEVLCDFSH